MPKQKDTAIQTADDQAKLQAAFVSAADQDYKIAMGAMALYDPAKMTIAEAVAQVRVMSGLSRVTTIVAGPHPQR